MSLSPDTESTLDRVCRAIKKSRVGQQTAEKFEVTAIDPRLFLAYMEVEFKDCPDFYPEVFAIYSGLKEV